MAQTHDLCTTPALTPPEHCPPARLPVLPNAQAAAFPDPSTPGEAAVEAALAQEPLGRYYYGAFVADPQNTAREALFTAYLNDWAGYNGLLCAVRQAAQAEAGQATDPERAAQLRALPAGIDGGLEALRQEPAPFELDLLLCLLDADRALATADFVRQVFGTAAPVLLEMLTDRSAQAQIEGVAQLRALLGAGDEGPRADRFDLSLDKLSPNIGFAGKELTSQRYGFGDLLELLLNPEASPTCGPIEGASGAEHIAPESLADSSATALELGQDLNPIAEFVVDALAGDWAGKAILRRYLANGGDWSIVDDPAWTAYMRDNLFVRTKVHDELTDIVAGLLPMVDGEPREFHETSHMKIQNGESAVGYQYLHGTNPVVGDFAIAGQAVASPCDEGQLIEATVRYTWNDLIDPNPRYTTDILKSLFAEIITFGGATPYTLAISWSSTCTLQTVPGQDFIVILDGWPGLAS